MSLHESSSSEREPTRELLLAQALDACIEAERHLTGSSDEVIGRQPAWARAELHQLVSLAAALDAAAGQTVIADDFRVAARERLMARIGGSLESGHASATGPWLTTVPAVPSANGHQRPKRLRSKWMWRGASGGLLAAALAVTATLTASASSLPGEPLYGIKQAREELGVRLAADDQARALALMVQADARLDEAARLLQQGRTADVAETTQRFDQVVERATTTYVVAVDESTRGGPTGENMESRLSQQEEQLQELLQTAPEPARADLREALVTTERGRALVADPRPVDRVQGRTAPRPPEVAAALPTVAAEDEPTAVPTPTQTPPTATPVVVVAEPPAPTPVVAESQEVEHEDAAPAEAHNEDRPAVVAPSNRGSQVGRVNPPPAPAPARVQGGQSRDQGRNQAVEREQNQDEAPPNSAVVADNPQARGDGAGASQATDRRLTPSAGEADRGGGGGGDTGNGNLGDDRGGGGGGGNGNLGDDRGGGGGGGNGNLGDDRGGGANGNLGDDRGGGGGGGNLGDDRGGGGGNGNLGNDRGGGDRGGGGGNLGDDRGGGGNATNVSNLDDRGNGGNGDDRGSVQPAQGGDARARSADDARANDDASKSAGARQPAPAGVLSSDDRGGAGGGDRAKSGDGDTTASPTVRNNGPPQVVITQPDGGGGNTDRATRDGRGDDLRPVLTASPTPTPSPSSSAPASAPLVKQAAATSTPTRRESGDSTSKNDSKSPSGDPPSNNQPSNKTDASHDSPAKSDPKTSSGGGEHNTDSAR